MSITIGDLKKFMAIVFSDDAWSMGEEIVVKSINVVTAGTLVFSFIDKDSNFPLTVSYKLEVVMKEIAETNK